MTWFARCLSLRTAALLALTLLSGCNFFAPPQNQPLELLANNPAATEIAALRATATIEYDRMMITMEAVNTAMRAVDLQSTRIASTLVARGTPFVDISAITPFAPTPFGVGGQNASAGVPSASVDTSGLPLVTPGGGAQGNADLTPVVPPPQVLGTPTLLPGAQAADPTPAPQALTGSALASVALSRAVGANDCPTQTASQFTTADTDIYVTALATVNAGSTISSRWLRDGAEIVVYDWTPDFALDQACIWFHMPASAVEYVPGNWTVEMTVDGTAAGSATFVIAAA
ncbi:MAG: hypothetical protein SF162_16180 [bacterium]|nr:hypothetical protein [bacterium]